MLSTAELAAIRQEAADWLPSSCVIQTYGKTANAGGGFTEAYTDGAPVACRIAPVGGGEEGRRGDRISDRTTHVLTLPAEQAIEETARVLVDGGQLYEVTAVRKRPALEVVRRVEVREAG
jgi:head-tail adaptor